METDVLNDDTPIRPYKKRGLKSASKNNAQYHLEYYYSVIRDNNANIRNENLRHRENIRKAKKSIKEYKIKLRHSRAIVRLAEVEIRKKQGRLNKSKNGIVGYTKRIESLMRTIKTNSDAIRSLKYAKPKGTILFKMDDKK